MVYHTQAVDALAAQAPQIKSDAGREAQFAHKNALWSVRFAREAWLHEKLCASSREEAAEVCDSLARCAAELGDDSPVTAKAAFNPEKLAMIAWLAVDAWRRAKGA